MLNFTLTPAQRFLCLSIRHCDYLNKDEIKSLYESVGDKVLLSEAKLNGVASIVAHSLTKVLGDTNVPKHWMDEYNEIDIRIGSYMKELEKVASLLKTFDIDLIALKNSGITMGLYPYFGACPMGDVDVLVSKSRFREAHDILTKNGYTLKFRSPLEEDNIVAAEQGGGGEYSVIMEDGEHLWFELQWRPVAGRWIQPEQEPSTDELISRSMEITESSVRLLSPEDNLLQVALHTAKHTFVRAPGFRLHTDVDRIVSTLDIDWNLFVSRVENLKVKTAVYFSLDMAKSLLGTPVPAEVLDKIRPSFWKVAIMNKWLDKVGIFEPDARKWTKPGYIVFVSLLYDDFSDFLTGVIPSSSHIKEHYGVTSNFALPYYYGLRIIHLLSKRNKV